MNASAGLNNITVLVPGSCNPKDHIQTVRPHLISQERAKQTMRSDSEYRLSIISNPESRRPSLSGAVGNGSGASGKSVRSGAAISPADDGEFILPQIIHTEEIYHGSELLTPDTHS